MTVTVTMVVTSPESEYITFAKIFFGSMKYKELASLLGQQNGERKATEMMTMKRNLFANALPQLQLWMTCLYIHAYYDD